MRLEVCPEIVYAGTPHQGYEEEILLNEHFGGRHWSNFACTARQRLRTAEILRSDLSLLSSQAVVFLLPAISLAAHEVVSRLAEGRGSVWGPKGLDVTGYPSKFFRTLASISRQQKQAFAAHAAQAYDFYQVSELVLLLNDCDRRSSRLDSYQQLLLKRIMRTSCSPSHSPTTRFENLLIQSSR
jgi:hypothetical protein